MADIPVKNTFIDITSPSLLSPWGSMVKRSALTCPGSRVGCLASYLQDSDATELTASPCGQSSLVHSRPLTPCTIQTPVAESLSQYSWHAFFEPGCQHVMHTGSEPLPCTVPLSLSEQHVRNRTLPPSPVRLADLLDVPVDVPGLRPPLSPDRSVWYNPVQPAWTSAPMVLPAPTVPPPPPGPALGSPELPSVGSSGHAKGSCRPCAFLHTKGCDNGLACTFCHLCEPGERKRRQKEKLQQRRAAQQARLGAKAGSSSQDHQ